MRLPLDVARKAVPLLARRGVLPRALPAVPQARGYEFALERVARGLRVSLPEERLRASGPGLAILAQLEPPRER